MPVKLGVPAARLVVASLILAVSGCGGGGNGSACPQSAGVAPNLSGEYQFGAPVVLSSTCPASMNNTLYGLFVIVKAPISNSACLYQVRQNGAAVKIDNRCGLYSRFDGCVDESGTVAAEWDLVETIPNSPSDATPSFQDCTATGTVSLTGEFPASMGETTMVVANVPLEFTGECGTFANCEAQIGMTVGFPPPATPTPTPRPSTATPTPRTTP